MAQRFRAYPVNEVRDAATALGVDPDFAEATYAQESSRGTNPAAMDVRAVKTRKGPVMVRGPFQVTDPTFRSVVEQNNLPFTNANDADAHLMVALTYIKNLADRFHGDYKKVAGAYFGHGTDETGKSGLTYAEQVMGETTRLKKQRGEQPALIQARYSSTPAYSGATPAGVVPGSNTPLERDVLGIPRYYPGANQGRRPSSSMGPASAEQYAQNDETPPQASGYSAQQIEDMVDEVMAGKNYG